MDVYFSDFFGVSAATIQKFGAFNISLVADLPLSIDPFLLFNRKSRNTGLCTIKSSTICASCATNQQTKIQIVVS
jgi:hypothetical protein